MRLGHHARIGGVNAVHIGIDVAALGADSSSYRHRRSIGAATSKRRDAPCFFVHALKAGNDCDLTVLLEALDQLGAVHLKDASRAVCVVGQDRQLPALPGARIDAHALENDREKSGSNVFAGCHNCVVFTRVM
jgi:2-polyprenyl-6-hydroxyphenyl methylase/3-demethylubiquinone-9 3-methyltransferase